MKRVFFSPVDSPAQTAEISTGAKILVEKVIAEEHISLEKTIALKIHVGEKGNTTFIHPDNFEGIIGFLEERGIDSFFTDTNALYSGRRKTREQHLNLAREHGFTRLKVIIADGEHGNEYVEVPIDKKHFRTAKIGRAIAEAKQMIVLSHFKGHALAGFGGAIKQLAMGGASRGGKLAQHGSSIPFINPLSCNQCGTCVKHCPADAIIIGWFSRINREKCIGCASCSALCPKGAVLFNPLASISRSFFEKLAEYAYAAQKDKENVYVSFALNITSQCDCVSKPMIPVAPDIGMFASSDPVALDQACLDMLGKRTGKKLFVKGKRTLAYAEEIGLGTRHYELVEINGREPFR
ncbi:DUF362 domain-containing protein [Candidatus Latescibacterota bacterium]